MITTIYITRHSEPLNFHNYCQYNSYEQDQIKNEKNPLSSTGEKLAYQLSQLDELKNIDNIYTSNYVRTICTAKYISEQQNVLINVDERLGERKFGISIKDLPNNYFKRQFIDWDYKINDGESLNETSKRMNEALNEIIKQTQGQRTVIVSHGTAITSMLKKYCKIDYDESNDNIKIIFNDEIIFNRRWKTPDLFKMEFEENNLISIKNIEI